MSINHWEGMTANIEPSMCLTDVVTPERVSDSLDEDVKALASIWREVPSRAHGHASLKLQRGPHMGRAGSFCLDRTDESNAFQRLDGPKLPRTQTFIPV